MITYRYFYQFKMKKMGFSMPRGKKEQKEKNLRESNDQCC